MLMEEVLINTGRTSAYAERIYIYLLLGATDRTRTRTAGGSKSGSKACVQDHIYEFEE